MKDKNNIETLVDINTVEIDTTLPKEEKIKEFIKKTGNPYHFQVGNMIVKSSFKENSKTLQDKMEYYFETVILS